MALRNTSTGRWCWLGEGVRCVKPALITHWLAAIGTVLKFTDYNYSSFSSPWGYFPGEYFPCSMFVLVYVFLTAFLFPRRAESSDGLLLILYVNTQSRRNKHNLHTSRTQIAKQLAQKRSFSMRLMAILVCLMYFSCMKRPS